MSAMLGAALAAEEFSLSETDSEFFQDRKADLTLHSLTRDRFRRGLSLGSAVGPAVGPLSEVCDRFTVAGCVEQELGTAKELADHPGVDIICGDLPDAWPQGSFDLIAMVDAGSYMNGGQLDDVIVRFRNSLADDGVALLCHWREGVEGQALDGDAVHARFLATSGLEVAVEHREESFLLHVLHHGLCAPND